LTANVRGLVLWLLTNASLYVYNFLIVGKQIYHTFVTMDFQKISLSIENKVSELFEELRSGISEREDSRAFGAMIEKRITQNWEKICKELGYEPLAIPGRRTIFDFACLT